MVGAERLGLTKNQERGVPAKRRVRSCVAGGKPMVNKNDTSAERIDQFFTMHSGRTDRWRDLTHIAREWADGRKQRADVEAAREALSVLETFYAYPGARVLSGLDECIAEGNAAGAAALAR